MTQTVLSNETFQATITKSSIKFRIWNTDISVKLNKKTNKIKTLDTDIINLLIKQQLETKTKVQLVKEVNSIIGYLLTLINTAENNDEKNKYLLVSYIPIEFIKQLTM